MNKLMQYVGYYTHTLTYKHYKLNIIKNFYISLFIQLFALVTVHLSIAIAIARDDVLSSCILARWAPW